uniref:Secreted protein n=1 Tax=Ixodes ricinus TaxID=34613 RepID=A0A6B0UGG8_IXORI
MHINLALRVLARWLALTSFCIGSPREQEPRVCFPHAVASLFAEIQSREGPDQVPRRKADIARAPPYVPLLLSAPRASNARRHYSPNSVT